MDTVRRENVFLVPGIFEGDFPKNAPGLLPHPLLLPMKIE